jgi:hypothetical protein
LAVATSSRNSTFWIPAGLTMLGVPSSVMPTNATGTPRTNRMSTGARTGSRDSRSTTFAARYR